ncbi:MAG TPA: NAD+ synthase [candidate division Zixibacteria bacterium]|nr:NAD+ synthase [candidate division Zixibacteria bacterium]
MKVDLTIDPAFVAGFLIDFLKREAGKFGFSKGIVGLSGGLDSSVSAFLAARAYGPENVLGILMPYKTSSPSSITDAEDVVRKTGIKSWKVEITPMVDAYLEAVPEADQVRRGNVMARCRMIILFDQSQKKKALVIGTSNKSEALLGYSTWFGDMASSINPLGDLYKTQERQLAAHLGVPESILKKPPSADLWAGQTVEGELGFTYELADQILYLLVDERWRSDEIIEDGFPAETVKKIEKIVSASQYKRALPTIAKLSRRTVGIDFQLSRDWSR